MAELSDCPAEAGRPARHDEATPVSQQAGGRAEAVRSWLQEWQSRHGRSPVLLVVPPVCPSHSPPLGPHVLQAIAGTRGVQVDILFANLVYSAMLDPRTEAVLGRMTTRALLGERLFCEAAFGLPRLGANADAARRSDLEQHPETGAQRWQAYHDAAEMALVWADMVAEAITRRGYAIVGCTSQYEQTAASIALLARVKRLRPEVVTLLGGANCEGEMAEGIASLPALDPGRADRAQVIGAVPDYVFSGESDRTFPEHLERLLGGSRPGERIIVGEPWQRLDDLPTPSFSDYYRQLEELFPPAEHQHVWSQVLIPHESSRGCWWGEKNHCRFCGLNAQGMVFRERCADLVLDDLRRLAQEYPGPKLSLYMTDRVMPHRFFDTLVPRLAAEASATHINYNIRANLTLARARALAEAGIRCLQPGIEALSDHALGLLGKGVSAAQNIAALRYARSVGINLVWNLLADFPGEERSDLEETIGLIRLISHLEPPASLWRITLNRFSPYFSQPHRHGISQVRPYAAYAEVFPAGTDTDRLAYFFDAEYESATRREPAVYRLLQRAVKEWRASWQADIKPTLHLHPMPSGKRFVLIDHRGLEGTEMFQLVSPEQARLALVSRRPSSQDDLDWALGQRVAVLLNGRYVALATAPADVLADLEST